MKDPMFQAEMRRMTQQPSFQAAVKQAQKMTDEIRNDPKKVRTVCAWEFLETGMSVRGRKWLTIWVLVLV